MIVYESTLSEVYEPFARVWAATHSGFDILHLIYSDGLQDLPLWFPDFALASPSQTLGGTMPTMHISTTLMAARAATLSNEPRLSRTSDVSASPGFPSTKWRMSFPAHGPGYNS